MTAVDLKKRELDITKQTSETITLFVSQDYKNN